MDDHAENQFRSPLLNVEVEANQQRARRAYTSLDLPQQQHTQLGNKNTNSILELNSNSVNINNNHNDHNAVVNQRHAVSCIVGGDSNGSGLVQQNGLLGRGENQIIYDQINNQEENANQYEEEEYEDENENVEEMIDYSDYQMSKLFISIFNDNRIFILSAILCDAGMGGLSQLVYSKRCDEMSDLQYWNYQWGFYFFAKAVYHFMVFTQFYSSSYKLDICQKLGEFRSPQDNEDRQREYEQNYSDRQRTQIRRSLDKQFLDYYYKRTSFLKWAYYLKSLVTLAYVIYGLVVFFSGSYFQIWISNNYNQTPSQACDYALTWWVYLSIIFVIACNRQIFDLILIIAIVGKVQGDTECTICRMDYVIDEQITILPCNELHHFHKDCIMSWLKVNMTCPLCRFNFAEESGGEEERPNEQIVPAQQGYIPPQYNPQQQQGYAPPLYNQQPGQIIFQNNQQQGIQNYPNNQPVQYSNQQQIQDQMILNQLIEMVDLFDEEQDLQNFLEANNYPPELQSVIIQLWHQRKAGLI